MPDYKIPGLWGSDIDRVGPAYNQGLGNAKVSTYAAGVDGYIQGQKEGIALESAALESQRLNDPTRLAQEELFRELRNEQVEKAIDAAIINNRSLDARNNALISSSLAAAALNRASAAGIREKTRLSQLTGEDVINSQILERLGKAEKDMASARGGGGLTIEDLMKASQITEKLGKPAGGSSPGKRIPGIPMESPSYTVTVPEGDSVGLGMSEEAPQPQNTLEAINAGIASRLDKIVNSKALGDSLDVIGQLENENSVLEMRTRAMYDGVKLGIIAKSSYSAVTDPKKGAAYDIALGSPNVEAALPHIIKISEAVVKSNNPKQQALFGSYLTDIYNRYNGADKFLNYVDENVQNPEQKKQIQGALFAATARSLTPDQLPQQQKDILQAGLGTEHIEDPNKTYDNISKLIAGNRTQVEDSVLKGSLTNHRFLAAAAEASADGKVPFTVKTRLAGAQQAEADVASGQPQADTYLEFSNTDGSIVKRVAGPRNEQEQALLSVFDRVSAQQAEQVGGKQRMDNRVAGIEQLQGDVRQAGPRARIQPTEDTGVPEESPSYSFSQDLNIPAGMGRDVTQPDVYRNQAAAQGADVTTTQPTVNAPTANVTSTGQPMEVGKPVVIDPDRNITQTLQGDGRNIAVTNPDFASPLYKYPKNADEHIKDIIRNSKEWDGNIQNPDGTKGNWVPTINRYQAGKEYNDRHKAFIKDLEDTQDYVTKNENQIKLDKSLVREVESFMRLAKEPDPERGNLDNTDLIGYSGYIGRFGTAAKALVGVASKKRQEVLSRWEELQSKIMKETIVAVGSSAANTAAEQENLRKSIAAGTTEFSNLQRFVDVTNTLIEHRQNVNSVFNKLKAQGVSLIGANVVNSFNKYKDSYISLPRVMDASGLPVKSNDFLNADQYLGFSAKPKPKEETPPDGTTPKGTPAKVEATEIQPPPGGGIGSPPGETPPTSTGGEGVGTQAKAQEAKPTEQPTPEAAPTKSKVDYMKMAEILKSTGGTEYSGRDTKELAAELESEATKDRTSPEFVKKAIEGVQQHYANEREEFAKEKASVAPKTRELIEQAMQREEGLGIMPDLLTQFANKVTPDFIENAGDALGGYIAELSDWMIDQTGGRAPGVPSMKELQNARVTAKKWFEREKDLQSPVSSILAEAAAMYVTGKGAGKLAVGGLGKGAEYAGKGLTATEGFIAKAMPKFLERFPKAENFVNTMSDLYKAAKSGAAAVPEKAVNLYGRIKKAAPRTAQVTESIVKGAGTSAEEATGYALVSKDGTITEKLVEGFVISAALQPVAALFKAGGRGSGRVLKNYLGTPDAEFELARMSQKVGRDLKPTFEKMAAAEAKGQNPLGVLDDAEKQIFGDIFATPGAQPAVQEAEGAFMKGAQQAIEKASGVANIAEAMTVSELNVGYKQAIRESINKAADDYGVQLNKEVSDSLFNSISNIATASRQKSEAAIRKLSEIVSPIIPKGVKEITGDIFEVTKGKIEFFKQVVKDNMSPVFQKIETTLNEVIPGNKIGSVLSEFERKYPSRAKGMFAELDSVMQREGVVNRDTFGYLANLREIVAKKEPGVTKAFLQQRSDMLNFLDDSMNAMIDDVIQGSGQLIDTAPSMAGQGKKGKRLFSKLLQSYRQLGEAERTLDKQLNIVNKIQGATEAPGDVSAYVRVFDPDRKMATELESIFGKKYTKELQSSLKSYDAARKELGRLQEAVKAGKPENVVKLSDDLNEALRFVGSNRNLGEELVGVKDPAVLTQIYNSLTPKNKKILGEAAIRNIKDRVDNFVSEGFKKASPSSTMNYKELLGYDTNQWNNLIQMVGGKNSPQAQALEEFLGKSKSVANAAELLGIGPKNLKENMFSKFYNMIIRRSIETDAKFTLDLLSSNVLTTMSKKEQAAVAKMLLDPDPKKVVEFVGKAADMLNIEKRPWGTELVLKPREPGAVGKVWDKAKIRKALINLWVSRGDISATRSREYLRRQEAARILQGLD